jgi:hypothetical protein
VFINTSHVEMDLDQLISLCKAADRNNRLRSVTKETMMNILATGPNRDAGNSDQAPLAAVIKDLTDEVMKMRATYEKMRGPLEKIEKMEREMESIKKENADLREQMNKQTEIAKQQQTFLERLDQKERCQNLIITGVPEDNQSDREKVMVIIGKLDNGESPVDADAVKQKRIGAKVEGKVRALLVTVPSEEKRNDFVLKARNNNDLGTGIRVKKDSHPAVRAEWTRLFNLKATEEAKAENAGKVVAIDLKKRHVTIDGQIIDSWKPLF